MHPRNLLPTFQPGLRTIAISGILLLGSAAASAQGSSNACGFNAANRYTVGTTCTFTAFNKPDAYTATFTPAGSTCGSSANDDAWGWFTATATTTNITYDPTDSHRSILHVFSGTCAALTQVACANAGSNGANINLTIATVPGANYVIRIQRQGTNNAMNGNLCLWSPVPNDTPCTATTLPLAPSCSPTSSTNSGATYAGVPGAPSCGNFTFGSRDVWFQFTAGPLGSVTLQSQAGSLTDGAMAVYTGATCSGTLLEVACDDDSGPGLMPFITLNNLTPGQVYFVRFWGYGSATGTFTICAQGVTALPAGQCHYVLNLYDSFGNGWGTSSVGVSINGGPYQYYTVTNAYNQVVIGANAGNIIALQYNNSGTFQDQNRYTLTYFGTPVYSSGTPPLNGLSYATVVTCQPPPPLPEDCVGGATLCSSQAFSSNANTSGAVADLSALNRGCLNALERQGTWYNFAISAPGTLGFTIAPTNPVDDYDFAVWGPFPPGSTRATICPPAAAPLRCSYSGLSGNTGLNNTALDFSEGAGGNGWVNRLSVNTDEVYLLYVSNYSISGLAFNLTWQLGSGSSMDCVVLPVAWLSFTASPTDKEVELEWMTGSEQGSSHFVVERSTDDVHYAPIGQVAAAGSSTSPLAYRFTDREPASGLNYYRIQQVDLDGASDRTDVVAVRFNSELSLGGKFPNPTNNLINMDIRSAAAEQLTIAMMDATGRLVRRHAMSCGAGINRFTAPVGDLEPGAYSLMVMDQRGGITQGGHFIVE